VTHLPSAALYRTIIVVDVAGFTDPARGLSDRLAVRQGMYEVLKTAFAESDVDFDSCVHDDRGDGALILLPPDIAKSVVADRLPDRIVAALRRYNSTRIPSAQFKLRVNLNSGDVLNDGNGWVGSAVDLAFRILEASEAKSTLAESDRMVAFISSEQFFAEVIARDPGLVPEAYRRIAVSVKQFAGIAYLRMLGDDIASSPTPVAGLPSADRSGPLLGVISDVELQSERVKLIQPSPMTVAISYAHDDTGNDIQTALVPALEAANYLVIHDRQVSFLNVNGMDVAMAYFIQHYPVVVVLSPDYVKYCGKMDGAEEHEGVGFESKLIYHKIRRHAHQKRTPVIPVAPPDLPIKTIPYTLSMLSISRYDPNTGAGLSQIIDRLRDLESGQ
jgi:hypothetical protein